MDFTAKVTAFIEKVKADAKDGLTLPGAAQIVYAFIELAVGAAQELGNPGPEKKALVLQWVGVLFDAIAPLVPVPTFYRLLQPFVRPYVKQFVLLVADGLLEVVYSRLKEVS